MRHYSDENRILIGLDELVSIARRKISPTVPTDEDEPRLSPASRIALKALGVEKRERIDYDFTVSGYDFHLVGYADKLEGDTLTLVRTTQASTKAQRKNEIAECRGAAFILGKIICESRGYDKIDVRIIYLREDSGEREDTAETVDRRTLDSFFEKCIQAVAVYAAPEVERVTERLPTVRAMRFPYEDVRDGQDEFIRRAYRTIARGGALFACAPTGTGKTVSVIYPALKALGEERVDKIFYLTPKTTTAEAARDCLELLESRGTRTRSVILTSKERCCPARLVCRESLSACELAKCNRLAEATMAVWALGKAVVDIRDISEIATRYAVCPYEVELSYSELCDVVICDFNYLFDPVVYIRRFFTEGGKFAFLIDEAHNLCDRAREMYSAELSLGDIDALLSDEVIGPLSKLRETLPEARRALTDCLTPYLRDDIRRNERGEIQGATHLSQLPSELYEIIPTMLASLEDEEEITKRSRDEEKGARLRVIRTLLYKVKKLYSALNCFDTGYRMFIFLTGETLSFRLFCLDTGKELQRRIDKGTAAVFFSATLSPLDYYRSVLCEDRSADTLEVKSPFDPSQLSVSIMDRVSTRYSERERTLPAVARVVAATLSARRGHYIVFAPSFEYAEALYREFSAKYPKVKCMLQGKNMSAEEKRDFLSEFSRNEDSYLLGFCVMGGIYSEGIDLVGDTLIGAVVVGIGMPSLSYEREAIAEYFQDKYDSGKEFAYVYPGMNRVFQAAGRVIRRESDRGVIVLIDDRFADPIYKKSIPSLWKGMQYISDAKDLRQELDRFWKKE